MSEDCKLIIFDLDGVLVETKDLHFNALNQALEDVDPKYKISSYEHISTYDGLPTVQKLLLLNEKKNLPTFKFEEIKKRKQELTALMLDDITMSTHIIDMIKRLHDDGYKIAVCSNAILLTIDIILRKAGLMNDIDFIMANDGIKYPKPNPEMYLRTFVHFGVGPNQVLIVEDSEIGRKAAILSGAHLCPVNSPQDVTYELVASAAGRIGVKAAKWKDQDLNILIPMAGEGSRFVNAGYTFPKPLIEVEGKPMIQLVVENINIDAHYIFLVRQEHYEKYNLKYLLNLIAPGCDIVLVDHLTEGAAMTTLYAEDLINNDKPLLIANSDQYLEWDSANFMYMASTRKDLDGLIPVFEATHPKWSFVATDEEDYVVEVAEKKPISNKATAGIYFWRKGSDYIKAVYSMTDKDIRTNGEFYIAPVYNEIIKKRYDKKKQNVGVYHFDKMWGIGTPEDLEVFNARPK